MITYEQQQENIKRYKTEELENYKKCKQNYLENRTEENWKKFCNSKRVCMLLGILI